MNRKVFLSVIAIFGTGLVAGYFSDRLWSAAHTQLPMSESKQIRQMGNYSYINPLLECEIADGSIDARKENFQIELAQYIEGIKQRNKLSEVAVYFRDLNNGPAFGVDETGEFFPASLLKVPVMMAYYRWYERDPSLFDVQIPFVSPVDFGYSQYIVPRETLVPGESYSIYELLRRMIVYSDNQALYLLSKNLPVNYLYELFSMLGVGSDVLTNQEAKLTVKEYAGFFRILFNSSYLSRDNSEAALSLLSSTVYQEALVAGVPSGIVVSHKFGEAGTSNSERQLHDCGIIYFPNHPYLACIMTRGNDNKNMERSITDISQFIYQKIDEQY